MGQGRRKVAAILPGVERAVYIGSEHDVAMQRRIATHGLMITFARSRFLSACTPLHKRFRRLSTVQLLVSRLSSPLAVRATKAPAGMTLPVWPYAEPRVDDAMPSSVNVLATPALNATARATVPACGARAPDAPGVSALASAENPPMYPIVSGSTDKVHGEALLARPATKTSTYVSGAVAWRFCPMAASRLLVSWKRASSREPRASAWRACCACVHYWRV
jgi:hypothetical protein